jgi:A/G-specific adenine glycosylase
MMLVLKDGGRAMISAETVTGVTRPRSIEFVERVLEWFEENGRDYPWRRTSDPYRVFVAEYMLQRTTPGHVLKVYEDFLRRYPSSAHVARAPASEISEVLYPLGMKHRAPLLKRALEKVEAEYGGRMPEDLDDLMTLPGVGPYTARAVMCFAYGRDLALVDVNVMRVLGRALGLRSDKKRPHTDDGFWNRVDGMIPAGRGREFNLSIIDLAALVCRRKKPNCGNCPAAAVCMSFKGRVTA